MLTSFLLYALLAVIVVLVMRRFHFMPFGMAALAADRITEKKVPGVVAYPVGASTKIFNGSIVALNSGGFAVPAADTAAFKVVGIANHQADNSAGADGDILVKVDAPIVGRFAATSITQAMVGTTMYVVDDQTFDDVVGTNGIKAGKLVRFISTTEGEIFIPGPLGAGVVDADADATYSANETTLINALKTAINARID